MRISPWLMVVVVGLSPATAMAKKDPFCAPIKAFVASVGPDDEPRTLKLRTSWGSNFKDTDEKAIFARRCEHGGYAPAEAACAVLMEHGATEFSSRNFTRVLACLSPKTRFGPGVSFHAGALQVDHGTPDRGNFVQLEFGADEKIGGMVLIVTTDGY